MWLVNLIKWVKTKNIKRSQLFILYHLFIVTLFFTSEKPSHNQQSFFEESWLSHLDFLGIKYHFVP